MRTSQPAYSRPSRYWVDRGLTFLYSGAAPNAWAHFGPVIGSPFMTPVPGGFGGNDGYPSAEYIKIQNQFFVSGSVASVTRSVFLLTSVGALPGNGVYPLAYDGTEFGDGNAGGYEIGVLSADYPSTPNRWFAVVRNATEATNNNLIVANQTVVAGRVVSIYIETNYFTQTFSLYHDGVFQSSVTNANVFEGLNTVGSLNIGTTLIYPLIVARFQGLLTLSDLKALKANPWQLFYDVPSKFYSFSDVVSLVRPVVFTAT